MKKLIKLLRQAHAIEVGAYNAYEGHWRSLKDSRQAAAIREIQLDELTHQTKVKMFLKYLKAKPSKLQDAILWIIGKTISISCYVIGYRAGMWGAKIMEKFGSICYRRVAKEALRMGEKEMWAHLEDMASQEEEHEIYFKLCLEQKAESGQ